MRCLEFLVRLVVLVVCLELLGEVVDAHDGVGALLEVGGFRHLLLLHVCRSAHVSVELRTEHDGKSCLLGEVHESLADGLQFLVPWRGCAVVLVEQLRIVDEDNLNLFYSAHGLDALNEVVRRHARLLDDEPARGDDAVHERPLLLYEVVHAVLLLLPLALEASRLLPYVVVIAGAVVLVVGLERAEVAFRVGSPAVDGEELQKDVVHAFLIGEVHHLSAASVLLGFFQPVTAFVLHVPAHSLVECEVLHEGALSVSRLSHHEGERTLRKNQLLGALHVIRA